MHGKIDYTIYNRQAVSYVLKLQRLVEKDRYALKIDIAMEIFAPIIQ